MRAHVVEALAVVTIAILLTGVIAAPVLRAPTERLFGFELAGRHHDPFTAMRQFERASGAGVYSQPVTDVTGTVLAQLVHPVAAYNWLVLLSFPLSALTAYLLARHLSIARAGATFVALAFAFSPFHLAHAAYHPHIAQTHWIPLYLLALWRCLDRASPGAIAFLGAATIAVALSNYYGGLIAAVITLPAIGAYWLALFPFPVRLSNATRRLAVTVGVLGLMALSGLTYVSYAASGVIIDRASFAFPRADVFAHSARVWSYFMPPAAHPIVGPFAQRQWSAAGVHDGLLEQQLSLGWGVIALALVAIVAWLVRARIVRSVVLVPALAVVAAVAALCSLSPELTVGTFVVRRPSAFFYEVLPMFRAYARFGVVVQLMLALLAGIGLDHLWRTRTRWSQLIAIALLALTAAEYMVSPAAQWRDVLPTTAHRWVMQQAEHMRVLDCTAVTQESASVPWLTAYRVTLPNELTGNCTEPDFPTRLAAHGYTHLLVRRNDVVLQSFAPDHPLLDGLTTVARFADAQVFAIAATPAAIRTTHVSGFAPREHNAEWGWRRMGASAAWTVVHTGTAATDATLSIEIAAVEQARALRLRFDGDHVQTLVVATRRRIYTVGPLRLAPGYHELTFEAVEEPMSASFAVGTWNWSIQGAGR